MTEKFSKAMLLILICFALGVSGYSQSSSPQEEGNRDSQANQKPSTGSDQNQSAPKPASAASMAKAVEYNVAQVELGKMASEKSENPRVKDFADSMVSDHTDALMKLSSLPGGNSSGVKMNAKHQQLMDRLSKLSGTQFDQAYMKAMVTDQQEHVKFLEQQSSQASGSGNDLPSVAKDLLPTARQNLQKAEEMEKEMASNPTTNQGARSKPTPDSQNQPDSQDQK